MCIFAEGRGWTGQRSFFCDDPQADKIQSVHLVLELGTQGTALKRNQVFVNIKCEIPAGPLHKDKGTANFRTFSGVKMYMAA